MNAKGFGFVAALLGAAACDTSMLEADSPSLASAALSAGVRQDLSVARAASARYHDVATAEADGYVAVGGCVASDAGTMGIHYVNFDRVLDGVLALEAPEALLYLPMNGSLRLVAIEYLAPIVTAAGPYWGCGAENQSCPPADPPPAPELYAGQPFNGPMAGHDDAMPWHYDQHVWLWAPNPSGMFSPWNPRLSCP